MGQRRLEKFIEPHKKYNLKFNASSDFKLSPYPELSGKYIKEIPIPGMDYKWFYAPTSVVKIYFLKDQYIIPAVQNVYIPIGRVQKIILVRPSDKTSGSIYFQFWLTNVESVKIVDTYDLIDFTLEANTEQNYTLPFPTHQLKVILHIPTNPTSLKIHFHMHPFNGMESYDLDYKTGIIEVGEVLNNVYKYDFASGSGAVTNPHYIFPSHETILGFTNEDLATDITGCDLRVISWED